jgi:hypothetical protein
MVVLVLLACLARDPGHCTTVNLAGAYPRRQCQALAAPEAQAFEDRNPRWRVSRSWCLRPGGLQV